MPNGPNDFDYRYDPDAMDRVAKWITPADAAAKDVRRHMRSAIETRAAAGRIAAQLRRPQNRRDIGFNGNEARLKRHVRRWYRRAAHAEIFALAEFSDLVGRS
tara:strand:+ start:1769 stop:2077 length:309 start_codon:yes stop_codon:yes gene_type:complete